MYFLEFTNLNLLSAVNRAVCFSFKNYKTGKFIMLTKNFVERKTLKLLGYE